MIVSISGQRFENEPFFLGSLVVPEPIVKRIAKRIKARGSGTFKAELQVILADLWTTWREAEPDCDSTRRFCEWLAEPGDWVKTDQVCLVVLQTNFI